MGQTEDVSTMKPHRQVTFREAGPGDYGWIVQQNGIMYWKSHGIKSDRFFCKIMANYLEMTDSSPDRSKVWVAEVDGEPVGSITLVEESEDVARIRTFFVLEHGRGLGIGTRLMKELIEFARRKGYKKIVLWSIAGSPVAKHVYLKAGFIEVGTEYHKVDGPKEWPGIVMALDI